MPKKTPEEEGQALVNDCSKLWKEGYSLPIIEQAVKVHNLGPLIRKWRKQQPELFPLRHKKHAPRRKNTSYDITLRFDAEAFGEFIPEYFPNGKPDPNGGGEWVGDSAEKLNKHDKRTFDQLTKKQQLSMIQYALREAGLLSPKFTQILSIK